MVLKNTLKLVVFTAMLSPVAFMAQSNEGGTGTQNVPTELKGLKILSDVERESGKFQQIDINSVSFYGLDGKKMSVMEFAPYTQNNDYAQDVYANDKGEIKAILLRKATEQEKEDRSKSLEKMAENEDEKTTLSPNLAKALQGLKKMTMEDYREMNGKPMRINLGDKNGTLIFLEDGTKLNNKEYMSYSKNKDYKKDFYVDFKKEIKAIVLKKLD